MTVSVHLGPSHTAEIPRCFGKYKYVRTLGRGGFSSVLLVQHRSQLDFYACKVVSREVLIEENIFDRFEQEVRLLPSLQHPHIVRFEEVVFGPEVIFVIMEYCAHGDLFSHVVRQGCLPEGQARGIFRQIADALAYVHGRDIAHRDVKPDNVLLDDAMNAKLADFGLCHSNSSRRLLRTPCGSPLYAPPEIVAGQEYDGKMADIWSLGVLLYTIVTGTLPWSQANQATLFREIIEANIDIPLYLSPQLQHLLENMLCRDPRARPSIDDVRDHPWATTAAREVALPKASSLFVKRPTPGAGAIGLPRITGGVKPAKTESRLIEPHRSSSILALRRQVPQAGRLVPAPNALGE